MDCLQKAVLRRTFRVPLCAHYLDCCCASTFFVLQWECVRAHTHVGGSGLWLQNVQREGRKCSPSPPPPTQRWWQEWLPLQKHTPKTAPMGNEGKAMWLASWAARMLWYTARQNRFLKIKEKDSRGPFLPLVVVDSPKHWVWRGFWSLEFDARLIHRLLRVCTRWPRVNEHKLITFAHQGNVQLNLICTLQLKIFEYFSGAFYWDKMALQESIKRTETNQQITAAIFHTLISQLSSFSDRD